MVLWMAWVSFKLSMIASFDLELSLPTGLIQLIICNSHVINTFC